MLNAFILFLKMLSGSVNVPLYEIPEAFDLSPEEFEGRFCDNILYYYLEK